MRKLLFLVLLIVGCKPSYVTEIPRDTNLRTGNSSKKTLSEWSSLPKMLTYYKYAQKHPEYKEIKARISSYFLLLQRAVSVGLPYKEVSYG